KNFIEMRDKVADSQFLERKKIEKDLGIRFAGVFNSVYEMVSFSHTPYAYALGSIEAQDTLLEAIMAEGDYFAIIKNAAFQSKLEQLMQVYQETVNKL